jgi:hypothetical protein
MKEGFRKLTFSGSDIGFFSAVLKDFEKTPDFQQPVCIKSLSDRSELNDLIFTPSNWTLTLGDRDSL